MRHCLGGGLLTGSDGILSPETFDFAFPSLSVQVACNHLICPECKQSVRAVDGFSFAPELRLKLKEARTATVESLVADHLLQPLAVQRSYFCECIAYSTNRLVYLEDEEVMAPNPPWRCAGHPEFALPGVLDGERIADDSDFAALLARAWSGLLALSAAVWHGDWPARLYSLLEPRPLAQRVADAALECILRPEPAVAVSAALFFATQATLPQAGRLPEIYRRDPDHFSRVQNPSAGGHDLRFWLLQSVARRMFEVEGDDATIAFAREIAVGPGDKPLQLLGALSKFDGDWVRKNASALKLANPGFTP